VSRRALVPVLEGRLRVFAALLEATSENLASLRRAEAQETFGADSFGLGVGLGGSRKSGYSGGFSGSAYSGGSRGFFESLGLYDDLNPGESSWSRTAKGRNSA
jgi:hypothetical protein